MKQVPPKRVCFWGLGDGKGACYVSWIISITSEIHVRQKGGLDA